MFRETSALLALCVGCTPVPPEVESTSATTSEPTTSTAGSTTLSSATDTGPVADSSASGSASSSGDGASSNGSDSGSSGTTGPVEVCTPLLAEALVKVGGDDRGDEWVRLYNPCDDPIDLEAYSLGWGGMNYTYGTADLTGTIDPQDCWLVGGANSGGNNGNPVYDQEREFDPELQNADTAADGIALFDVEAGSIQPNTVPIDAVIYGDANDSNLLGPDNTAPPPHVDVPSDSRSIRRTSLEPTWEIADPPTPNDCPVLL